MFLEKFHVELIKQPYINYTLTSQHSTDEFIAYSLPNSSVFPQTVKAGDFIYVKTFKAKISNLENDAKNLIQTVMNGYTGDFYTTEKVLRMPVYSWNPEKDECEVGMVCLDSNLLIKI